MKNIKKYLLVFILIIAAILRLWKLGNVPPSLTSDEAALGYNAYSILKTGRDEYGKFLPVIFKSFGDYKPGLYVYLAVPSVATLGLNEFSVRLPSALFGILSVCLIYLIVKKLFLEEKLAMISSFIAAINPWSIYFSRGAWEVNIALTLTLAGIYFFLVSLEEKKYLLLSIFFFALTLIAYQGAKLSTGIVILILLILYWREILRFDKKIVVAGLAVGFVVCLPIVLSFFQGGTGRLNVFSVFSYPRPKEYLQLFLDEGKEKVGDLNYYLFHLETLNFTRGILGRWFNHYSDRFLFFEGDWPNPRHSAPNQGVFLLGDLMLIVVGIVALVKEKLSKGALFIWLWIALAPLPAILSRDQVHAVRSFNLSVPLIILLGFGAVFLLKKLKRPLFIILSLGYACSFVYFLDAYFVHLPKHNSEYWQYGYKQIVETVTPLESKYKNIRIQQSFAQPYIYFLFFQKYDPAKYQKQAQLVASEYKNDVGYITKLDNILFVPIDWSIDRGDHGDLVVADPIRIPAEDSADTKLFTLIKEIKYSNGKTAFRIIAIK